MKTINKQTSLDHAMEKISSGQTIMVGGFGVPGTPFMLIQGLLDKNLEHLTLIKNEANEAGMGLSKIIEAGAADKLITSHLGLNSTVIGMMNDKKIQIEFFPQGILAEKIRAGGAGLAGILTDIGMDTLVSENKQVVMVDDIPVIVEQSLRADVALVHAAKADMAGNLIFEKSARNFNPIMAMAADLVIVEAEEIVPTGAIDPDAIHLPCAFVDHVVLIKNPTGEYGVLKNHVIQA